MFALIDGNSFFASCEKVFRPDLWRRPVVVLSNNDGCIVARSAEARALNIAMGVPFFKVAHLIERHNVAVFSSNYELYGDLSARMMHSVASLVPEIEIYSIDEVFADLSGMRDLTRLGREIKGRVFQWVGLPNCVGIAPTKTLAKFANHLAKTCSGFDGVCNWEDLSGAQQQAFMKRESVAEVWGIGRRMRPRLEQLNIRSVYDLAASDPRTLRARYGVVMERVVRELRGYSCLELEDVVPEQKQILRSRSFGGAVTKKEELRAALTMHLGSAAATLRELDMLAGCVGIMIYSNRFRPDKPQQHGWAMLPLAAPSCDTLTLMETANRLLEELYRPDIEYKKAGVVLMDLTRSDRVQRDWMNPGDNAKRVVLMQALDQINARYGGRTVRQGAEYVGSQWHTRRERLSPRYTTRWDELLRVK